MLYEHVCSPLFDEKSPLEALESAGGSVPRRGRRIGCPEGEVYALAEQSDRFVRYGGGGSCRPPAISSFKDRWACLVESRLRRTGHRVRDR
jgi:hypothetical protein